MSTTDRLHRCKRRWATTSSDSVPPFRASTSSATTICSKSSATGSFVLRVLSRYSVSRVLHVSCDRSCGCSIVRYITTQQGSRETAEASAQDVRWPRVARIRPCDVRRRCLFVNIEFAIRLPTIRLSFVGLDSEAIVAMASAEGERVAFVEPVSLKQVRSFVRVVYTM
jgi:hypothetical protein